MISHKCRIICWLILAPRHPMNFFHKTFPGTTNETSDNAKFHSSCCLISWLPKTELCEITGCSPPLVMGKNILHYVFCHLPCLSKSTKFCVFVYSRALHLLSLNDSRCVGEVQIDKQKVSHRKTAVTAVTAVTPENSSIELSSMKVASYCWTLVTINQNYTAISRVKWWSVVGSDIRALSVVSSQ